MNTLTTYAVWDRVMGKYEKPVFSDSDASVIRGIEMAMADARPLDPNRREAGFLWMFAQDLELHCLGVLDLESGDWLAEKRVLCSLLPFRVRFESEVQNAS